jgi:hypothetical protein
MLPMFTSCFPNSSICFDADSETGGEAFFSFKTTISFCAFVTFSLSSS